jgi:hypothetical protein
LKEGHNIHSISKYSFRYSVPRQGVGIHVV